MKSPDHKLEFLKPSTIKSGISVSKNSDISVARTSGISVVKTNNKKDQQKWDKPQYCLYCLEKKSKIARNLDDVHANEIEVAEVMSIELKD